MIVALPGLFSYFFFYELCYTGLGRNVMVLGTDKSMMACTVL